MNGSIPLKYRNHPLEKAANRALLKMGQRRPKHQLAMLTLLLLLQDQWWGPMPERKDLLLEYLLLLEAKSPSEVFTVLQLTTRPPWEAPLSRKELRESSPVDLADVLAEELHDGLIRQDNGYKSMGMML